MSERPTSVDFHFDIMCPWAYQTSVWMRDVRDQLGLEVKWRFFSLEEINRREGKKHPWEREWSYGWSMMRIGARLRELGMERLDEWYQTAGTALHVHGHKPHDPDVARSLVAQMGLDAALVDDAIADPHTHEVVKAEHDKVVDAGGYGVPTLFFDTSVGEQAIFGPVLINPPSGDAAIRLWDAVCAWLEFPELYEMQRPKTKDDERAIARAFRPYVEARDWVSINRGKEVAITADGFEIVDRS